MERARPPILSHGIGNAVEDDPAGIHRGRPGPRPRQEQREKRREQRELIKDQRLRRFGCRHASHAHGDRPVEDGVRQCEQRADLERSSSGMGDDEHAAKAHEQRHPTSRPHRLLEQQRGDEGREQRRGKVDGDGAGKRHQAEGDQQKRLRAPLRNRTHHVMGQAPRAKDGKPGLRHDEERASDERNQGSGEENLADRVACHQPFRNGARGRKHNGGGDHVENAERDMFPSRRLRWCDEAACLAHRPCLLPAGQFLGTHSANAQTVCERIGGPTAIPVWALTAHGLRTAAPVQTRAARWGYGMARVRPGIPGRHDRPANLVVALARAF